MVGWGSAEASEGAESDQAHCNANNHAPTSSLSTANLLNRQPNTLQTCCE